MNDFTFLWLGALTVLSVIGWIASIRSRQNMELKLAEAYYGIQLSRIWGCPHEYVVLDDGKEVGRVIRDFGSYELWNGRKTMGLWFYRAPKESLVMVLSRILHEDKE